jgi:L,D-transpeptidase-like protein
VLSKEGESEPVMRNAIKLTVALLAIGLASKLSAQQKAVIINLTEQTAYLLEGGRVAFISPIASGKEGWGTPTGNFRIIRKDLNHRSGSFGLIVDSYGRIINPNATPSSYVPRGCRYEPAPMPYFMEFRKSVGMHAGYLPGYPASHGCIRMPRDLAAEFFTRLEVGTPVNVIGNARTVTHVRRAIPIVQPGNYAYARAYPGARQVFRATRNIVGVRRAIPVVQTGHSRLATAFFDFRRGTEQQRDFTEGRR